jgi:ubiquinone/menaquinone biosynthesis C-methylase UbiE
MSSPPEYVLGSSEAEVARLDVQAAAIAPATALLLQAGGIAPGMRVLDLGTGPGHVAFMAAELVGPEGFVLGVDQSLPLLEVAERRRQEAGAGNVAFEAGDARGFRADEPFDAVVTRLLLFHLPDAVDVLRAMGGSLKPGGPVVAIDFDLGASRTEPPVALAATALAWIEAGFRAAGADPRIGARLAPMLSAAGYEQVTTIGIQGYLQPDQQPERLLGGVVRALAPQIVANGIATEAELDLDTFEERLAAEVAEAGAVVCPPGVVGAWAVRP